MPFPRSIRCFAPRHKENSFVSIGIGICVGLLLGVCLKFETQTEIDQRFIASLPEDQLLLNSTDLPHNLWIRCVVLIQPDDPRPYKYVQSILDTYARRCNKTVFFTSEEKLLTRFHDKTEIFAVNNFNGPHSYSFFHLITQLVYSQFRQTSPSSSDVAEWTIFLNEQNFVIPENLRVFLKHHDPSEALVFGRLGHSRYLFPFLQTEMFQIDSGVVLSNRALELIATSNKCRPHWLIPGHTGKGLFACGMQLNLRLIDPVDEVWFEGLIDVNASIQEGHHLFLSDNLRNMFSSKYFSANKETYEGAEMNAGCCSDRLISVGSVNHRDIRVMEYVVNRIRVFGHNY
ncbi:hypothetical protein M3Y95_00032700 [Aphelenchoides besseyi]|nr:hypothetical protein M3Y95_00032700 [Aphelenchoides besseyi]